jgi:hypothetical protein
MGKVIHNLRWDNPDLFFAIWFVKFHLAMLGITEEHLSTEIGYSLRAVKLFFAGAVSQETARDICDKIIVFLEGYYRKCNSHKQQ